MVADAGHTVRDGYGGQTAAIIEGIVANAGHTVGDGYGGQAAAIFVFVSCLISII